MFSTPYESFPRTYLAMMQGEASDRHQASESRALWRISWCGVARIAFARGRLLRLGRMAMDENAMRLLMLQIATMQDEFWASVRQRVAAMCEAET